MEGGCQVSPWNSLNHNYVSAEKDLKYQLIHSLQFIAFLFEKFRLREENVPSNSPFPFFTSVILGGKKFHFMVGYTNEVFALQLDLRETLLEISLQKLVIRWNYASSRMSLGTCSEDTTRKKIQPELGMIQWRTQQEHTQPLWINCFSTE